MAPSGPPSPRCALTASAPPDSAPHTRGGVPARCAPRLQPPQPLPGAQLRSHLPSPADVRQQARPLPTAGREGVCAPQLGRWGGGQGRVRTPGGVGAGRAPQGRLSWRLAGSRPEGANPHCERWEVSRSGLRRAAGGLWECACVWANLNHRDRSRLLAPGRGAIRSQGLGSASLWFEPGPVTPPDPVECSYITCSSVAKLAGGKQGPDCELLRTGARAQGEVFALLRVADIRFGSSCRFVGRGGRELE